MHISLTYNGLPVGLRDDWLNLTDMWKAAGADPSRKPIKWLDSADAQRFIEFLAEILKVRNFHFGENQGLMRTVRGGNTPRTEAHWQVGLAYAKYLSPEFHVWCNTVVRERMEDRTKPRKAVSGILLRTVMEFPDTLRRQFPALSDTAVQTAYHHLAVLALGEPLVSEPTLTQRFWTTTEIAEEAGMTAIAVGKKATAAGLKTTENGELRLSTSPHSSKQIEQFHWNPEGRTRLLNVLRTSQPAKQARSQTLRLSSKSTP